MKKVLIITYYWPPAGGIGVLRCLKIAKYLRDNGWEPVIFTSTASEYEFLDDRNHTDVPENLEVHRIKGFNPTALFKRISGRAAEKPLLDIIANSSRSNNLIDNIGIWIRGNFFIPDARMFWAKPAEKAIRDWLMTNQCDALFSDGPPHTNTLVALKIANAFDIPWLADFQDPWTQADYYAHMKITPWAHKVHRKWESRALERANFICIASPSWADDLKALGRNDAEVLYYGYDEADFENYEPIHNTGLTIFHGGLLGKDRRPRPLIDALSNLKETIIEQRGHLEIRLAGSVDQAVIDDFENAGLGGHLNILGLIPRQEVLAEMAKASILLLPINDAPNAKGRIPGKLFEMVRSKKPIIALGQRNGDVAQILSATGAGETFEYDDSKEVQQYISDFISNHPRAMQESTLLAIDFSNERLTKQVSGWLDAIVSNKESTKH